MHSTLLEATKFKVRDCRVPDSRALPNQENRQSLTIFKIIANLMFNISDLSNLRHNCHLVYSNLNSRHIKFLFC